ncbi:MAG: hypothetical protein M1834_008920 [Cirrosporium novae-zelandiae]|nr:MAG: hypothetical protein M1834_008920 [Cirrosporium novae-zelandiae]
MATTFTTIFTGTTTATTTTTLKITITTTPITTSSSTVTTASTAATPTNSTPQKGSYTPLPARTVAGIVIGTAIGLAFITFVATYMWMRCRSNRRQEFDSTHALQHRPNRPHNTSTASSHSTSGQGDFNFLPPTIEDRAISNKVWTLLEQISLHVENFYSDSIQDVMTTAAKAELAARFNSPYLPKPVEALLESARHPSVVIEHCLCFDILRAISPSSDPGFSFLPREFVLLPSQMKDIKNPSERSIAQRSLALSSWRTLSVYLRPQPFNDRTYLTFLDEAIEQAVQSASLAFAAFQNHRHKSEDRIYNLTEIMKSAAEIGVLLFSQPNGFLWEWGTAGNREDGGTSRDSRQSTVMMVVVSPSLVKETDEKGRKVDKKIVLVEKVRRRI